MTDNTVALPLRGRGGVIGGCRRRGGDLEVAVGSEGGSLRESKGDLEVAIGSEGGSLRESKGDLEVAIGSEGRLPPREQG